MASQCCDFIANVKSSGVAHSFLETEFNQIKCFHLKANINLVTMKGKSSTYLNKPLIPEKKKKKKKTFYRPGILLSQYNATVKDLVSVNRRSNSDHQLSQISCTNTTATGLMPLPHKSTVLVQTITLPTVLFPVQKPRQLNSQKEGTLPKFLCEM